MERISKMWRSALAMVMAICLVIGLCPAAAFAAIPGVDVVKTEADYQLSTLEGFLDAMPSVATEAYKLWQENGYQETIEKYIPELIEVVASRSDYYENEVLPALAEIAAPLVAEKEPLLAELNVLLAELLAKKAELEALKAEIEIPSIAAPDLSIDVEIGNNEQTNVPANDCEGAGNGTAVSELEAAIADIEHAIAVVEALIADVKADIEDMVALVNEITEAVASLQKTLADVAAAAEALKDAVDAVVDFLTNDTADSTTAAFVSTYNAVREAALVAANAMNELIVLANEETETVNAAVAVLEECAIELGNELYADRAEIMALLPDGLGEYVDHTKYTIAASIYFTLWLRDATPEALAAKKAELEAKLEELLIKYDPEIQAAKAKVDELIAEYGPIVEAYIAENAPILEAAAKAEIAALKAAAEEKLEELNAELDGYLAELAALPEDAAAELFAPIQAQIDRVNGDIATVKADLECAIAHVEAALEIALNALAEEADKLYNEALAAAQNAYDKIVAAYNAAVAGILAQIAAIDAAINETVAAIIAAINELKNNTIQSVKDLVDAIVSLINQMLDNATGADLVLDETSTYVALGDSSAVANGYAEIVANELKAQFGIKGSTNYAVAGNTVGAELANIASYEELPEADLITIGFSNVTLLNNALTNALVREGSYDWTELVTAEQAVYVEAALTMAKAEIAAMGLDEETAAMLVAAVEGIAYGAAEYIVKLPQLVAAIRETNEDAVIAIVGQYNPMSGVVLNLGETTLDIADYVDYFVTGVSAYCFAYALTTGEAIFVNAPAVEIANTDVEWTIADLTKMVVNGFESLNPSVAGDAYIAEQILAALNITRVGVGLWGDADGDGVVNLRDAILILQFANGKDVEIDTIASDVTGDGAVNVADAIRVLKRANGHADLFPVEQ